MVSSSHEVLHRIFQQEPGLFARVARNRGVAFPPPMTATELSTDLTETRPLERRVTRCTTQAADLWRHLMAVDLSFFQSQTAQQLRAEGRAEGQAKGILVLLSHRGVEVTEGDRDRIAGCGDPEVLSLWFTRAITATSAAEVFAETAG